MKRWWRDGYNSNTGEMKMYALEFTVEIDESRQIHLQLPDTIPAQTARVIILYEETTKISGCGAALNDGLGA